MAPVVKVVKRLPVWILGLCEIIIGFLLFYLVLAITLSIVPYSGEECSSGVKVFVKTNGVHTDICLPVETEFIDWRTFIPPTDFPKVSKFSYISIGWGDKGFYLDTPTWADLKFSTAFNAAFLGGETAMHVQYLEESPQVSETIKMKFVSPEKYLDLIDYVKDSFQKTSSNSVDLIPGKGYWSSDNFYEASGTYNLFNTCNAWTNGALKVAGIRTAVLALFSDGIMRHL